MYRALCLTLATIGLAVLAGVGVADGEVRHPSGKLPTALEKDPETGAAMLVWPRRPSTAVKPPPTTTRAACEATTMSRTSPLVDGAQRRFSV